MHDAYRYRIATWGKGKARQDKARLSKVLNHQAAQCLLVSPSSVPFQLMVCKKVILKISLSFNYILTMNASYSPCLGRPDLQTESAIVVSDSYIS